MTDVNLDKKRWLVAAMGTSLQICLGTAYAWSFFQKPISSAFGWSQSMTAWAFCVAICFLGLSAAVGGVILPKTGPRVLAMCGGGPFLPLVILQHPMHLKARTRLSFFLPTG